MAATPQQIPLAIRLDEEASWDNWVSRPVTQSLEAALQQRADQSAGIYLWGKAGSGRSHLLQAVCLQAQHESRYLPLSLLTTYPPQAVFEQAELSEVIVIDDLESISESRPWQEALFHLFNRALHSGATLVIAGDAPPQQLGGWLPDLQSRLGSLLVFHLPEYDDVALRELFVRRVQCRGIVVSDEVVNYVMTRTERSPRALMALIDIIDQETLIRGRSLSIPLLRDINLWS
jgi:DnaA family protein